MTFKYCNKEFPPNQQLFFIWLWDSIDYYYVLKIELMFTVHINHSNTNLLSFDWKYESFFSWVQMNINRFPQIESEFFNFGFLVGF